MIVQIAQDSVPIGVHPYYKTPFALDDYYAYEKECPIDKTKACYRFQFEFYDTWASGMSLERRGDPYYHISKYWNGTVLSPSSDIKEPEFKKARMDAIQNAAKKREDYLQPRIKKATEIRDSIINICSLWKDGVAPTT